MNLPGTNLNQLFDMDFTQPVEVWGPAICTGNLVMIFGGTGVGKSRFVNKLLWTITSGGVFLQHECKVPRKGLLIEGELGLAATQRRLNQIRAEAPYSPKGDYLRVFSKDHSGGRLPNLANVEDQKRYNAIIGDADVIVIDNLLSSIFPVDRYDDDVKQWDRIIPWLFSIRDSGRTVILVHHTGKSGLQLGTSIKENWLDTNIQLTIPEITRPIKGTEFELHYRKTRDVKKSDAQPLHIEYVEDHEGISRWLWRPLHESRDDQIRNMKAEGMTRREIAKQLGLSYRAVSFAWKEDDKEDDNERDVRS